MSRGYSVKITAQGHTTASALDQWQWGIHWADPSAVPTTTFTLPTSVQLGTLFNGALKTFHQSADLALSKAANLKSIKAALIGPDGKYAAEPIIYEGAATPGTAPGTTDQPVPPQVALAVTLWSGATLGTQNYGRFFLPMPCMPLDLTTAGFSGATATAIATAAKTYITAVTTLLRPLGASNTNLSASIMPADASKTPKVAFYVRVGQLKDTQRRRRNALRENPSVVAL